MLQHVDVSTQTEALQRITLTGSPQRITLTGSPQQLSQSNAPLLPHSSPLRVMSPLLLSPPLFFSNKKKRKRLSRSLPSPQTPETVQNENKRPSPASPSERFYNTASFYDISDISALQLPAMLLPTTASVVRLGAGVHRCTLKEISGRNAQ